MSEAKYIFEITQKAGYTIFETSVLLRGLGVPGLPDTVSSFRVLSLQETADFRAYQPGVDKGFRLAKDQRFQGLARDRELQDLPETRDFRACQRREISGLDKDQRFQGLPETKGFRACQRPGI